MRSRIFVAALASAAVALAAWGCAEPEPPPPPPPPEVQVAQVIQRVVPVYIEAIGQTRGSTEIEVRARVEGFIQTVDLQEGSPVRKGQLLYTIDPRPLEATLAQAKGALAGAEGTLLQPLLPSFLPHGNLMRTYGLMHQHNRLT